MLAVMRFVVMHHRLRDSSGGGVEAGAYLVPTENSDGNLRGPTGTGGASLHAFSKYVCMLGFPRKLSKDTGTLVEVVEEPRTDTAQSIG